MSYFDQASLVMIPSGYKTSKVYSVKPTDGSGDLAFSRSNDTATRVGPDGLIEKVRTNLSFYSEQFDNGFWNKLGTGLTVTANTTIAPNGTLTADTLNVSNNDNVLYGSRSGGLAGNEFTFSIYVKGTGTFSMNIRLNSLTTTTETKTLTSDWQRFSVSVTNAVAVTSVEFYLGLNTSSTYNVWGAQVESSPVATDYIATTSAAVSVGPVANVPRLDYLNSSCPRLLLEPQRTNLVTYSEQIDNAAWPKINATIAANNTTSPDGYVNADKYTKSATGGSVIYQANKSSATANTFSIFAKNDAVSSIRVGMSDNGNTTDYEAIVNLANGTIVSTTAGATSKIENYGNGWYRISITRTSLGTVNPFFGIPDAVTGSFFAYGCQLEGAYATSYIPTLGAAVTRGADACSKTGISSLIGQTEGTIFVEEFHDATVVNDSGFDDTLAALTDGTSNNVIGIFHYGAGGGSSNKVLFFIRVSNVTQAAIFSDSLATGTYKIAAAYKNNDVVLYINGVQIGTDTSATIPATSVVTLVDPITTNAATKTVRESQVLLFKTRLTNAQLAELTTI